MTTHTRLIAIDWGTTNLRASLLSAAGEVLDTRSTPGGIMSVREGRFADSLLSLCADWISQSRPALIASGMIGSRQGWKEADYLPCPAGLPQAAAQLTRVDVSPGVVLHIVPGLSCLGADGEYDVMRGEETQLWGAALDAGTCCVLPGTHAKWAWMGADGRVEHFATYMTGELYGLLTQHGILGRLMTFGTASPRDFEAGVRRGLSQAAQATHALFAARTAGLMGRIAADGLPDFLSGMLLGFEIAGATVSGAPERVVLLGDDALCDRYAQALSIAGIAASRAPDVAVTHGQWRVAQAAGLLGQQP